MKTITLSDAEITTLLDSLVASRSIIRDHAERLVHPGARHALHECSAEVDAMMTRLEDLRSGR